MFLLTVALYGCIFSLNSCTEKKAEIIKIGAMLPLSGNAAQYGEWGKNGISLAVDEINSKGGIKGNKIEVVYEDDAADPKKGVSAVNKLISIDKVKAIIGPLPSAVTLAVAPICEKYKIVIMSSSSSPAITHAGDYIFRNWPSDDFEGSAMAKYAIKKGFKKIAILHINNEYGLGVAKVFKREYSRLGGDLLITETYQQGSSDMRAQIIKIKKYNPDAIYLIGHAKENGHVIKQLIDLNTKAKILGTVGIESPDLINIAGESANGIIYTAPTFDPKNTDTVVKTFQEAYARKYSTESNIFSAIMYDALKIIALMIEQYSYDSDEIKAGLYKLNNYPGVSGITTFDQNGDVIKPVVFKTINNKQFVYISE
ncbi:MAG: Extracellular ligand-binding receptor [Candidatus Brocadiaceae bacterium]|nr:Extracellular ligand-binding receptor [Candidatus Brocadiaceae bacterium]